MVSPSYIVTAYKPEIYLQSKPPCCSAEGVYITGTAPLKCFLGFWHINAKK